MRSITFAFDIQALNPDKIMSGDLTKIIVRGYSVFPVYAIQEDIVILQDRDGKDIAFVAVKGFRVTPSEEITEEEATAAGFATRDEALLYLKDELLATVVEVIPVIHEHDGCECEGECDGDCDGECDGKCEECHCHHQH